MCAEYMQLPKTRKRQEGGRKGEREKEEEEDSGRGGVDFCNQSELHTLQMLRMLMATSSKRIKVFQGVLQGAGGGGRHCKGS